MQAEQEAVSLPCPHVYYNYTHHIGADIRVTPREWYIGDVTGMLATTCLDTKMSSFQAWDGFLYAINVASCEQLLRELMWSLCAAPTVAPCPITHLLPFKVPPGIR